MRRRRPATEEELQEGERQIREAHERLREAAEVPIEDGRLEDTPVVGPVDGQLAAKAPGRLPQLPDLSGSHRPREDGGPPVAAEDGRTGKGKGVRELRTPARQPRTLEDNRQPWQADIPLFSAEQAREFEELQQKAAWMYRLEGSEARQTPERLYCLEGSEARERDQVGWIGIRSM